MNPTPHTHPRRAPRSADPPTRTPGRAAGTTASRPALDAATGARSNGWTIERIRALGTLADVPTTGSIFGMGRSAAYHAARTGTLPVPVLKVGQRQWVTIASILAVLDVPADPAPADSPAT